MNVQLFFLQPLGGLTNQPPVRDSDPGTPLFLPHIYADAAAAAAAVAVYCVQRYLT
jgi:hypothetical protein